MTGSRLGWVCAAPDVVARLADLATHTTYGIPGFIQQAGLYALSLGPAFEARIAAPFLRRRALTAQVLDGQNLIRSAPMQGAMYAVLDIRATGLSGEAFAEALLDAEHIAVMPGESFGAATAGHVRVAMTVDDARYVDALRRLVAFAGRLAQTRAASERDFPRAACAGAAPLCWPMPGTSARPGCWWRWGRRRLRHPRPPMPFTLGRPMAAR